MERRELARNYLEGQISRRVFLRRVVALGITLPAAVAYADLLRADPARAQAFDYYVYVSDFQYDPATTVLANAGQIVEFGFAGLNEFAHSATDPTRVINSGFKTAGSAYATAVPYAGTFSYRCKETTHDVMTGRIRVPMSSAPTSGPLGTAFELGWSTISGGPFTFDVQRRRPSEGSFQDWIVDTSNRAVLTKPKVAGTYRFRSRARRSATGKVSGWSPVLTIEVT